MIKHRIIFNVTVYGYNDSFRVSIKFMLVNHKVRYFVGTPRLLPWVYKLAIMNVLRM